MHIQKILLPLVLLLLLSGGLLNAQITITDLSRDRTLTIIIDLDENSATIENSQYQGDDSDQSDDYEIGNSWYLARKVIIKHEFELGMSGSQDFIMHRFMFQFRFASATHHAFSIRGMHHGFTSGALSGNFTFYNFSVLAGFEYLFKVFNKSDGFFCWLDVGGGNGGFAIQTGLGLGSRFSDGIELSIAYLQGVGIFSHLDFYFLMKEVFVLRGKLGINSQFDSSGLNMFTFHGGVWLGGQIKNRVRLLVGGGFTVNEFSYFNGFGGITVVLQVP